MKGTFILMLVFCTLVFGQFYTRKPMRSLSNAGKIQADMVLPAYGYTYIGNKWQPWFYGYFRYTYVDSIYALAYKSKVGELYFSDPTRFGSRVGFESNASRVISTSFLPDRFGYTYIGAPTNYFDYAYIKNIHTYRLNIEKETDFAVSRFWNGENLTSNEYSGVLKNFVDPSKTNSSTSYLNNNVKYVEVARPLFRDLHYKIDRQGGYACRIDDIHGVELINVAEKFNKYGFRATNATNICAFWNGKWLMDEPEYRAAYAYWVGSGHEVADHTPNGNTRFALVKHEDNWLSAASKGVDAVFTGTFVDTVYFEYAQHLLPAYVEADNTTHPADLVAPNYIVSQANGAYGTVNKEAIERFGLVSYGGNLYWVLEHRDLSAADPDTLVLGDYYGRDNVSLTAATNITYTYYDADSALVLTVDGLRTMMQITKFYFNKYGIPEPKFFVQPGNNLHVRIDTMIVAARYEGYYGADLAEAGDNSYLGQHGYKKDRRYAFNFKRLQFNLYSAISTAINSIAENYGTNTVSTSITHLESGYLGTIYSNLDSILTFLYTNNIPVGTLTDWTLWQYYANWNESANIAPPMENDFDNDNVPDGYVLNGGLYDKTDGSPEDAASIYKSSSGDMFYVNFNGPVNGMNTIGVWTKGATGDSINIVVTMTSGTYTKKIPADTPGWSYYEFMDIPVTNNDNSIRIDIDVANYSSGVVKVSGLKFKAR